MNSKIISRKRFSVIFLAIVLVTGTITALSFPSSIMGTAQAQPYYYDDGIDNRYNNYEQTPQYPSYGNNNYESKDSSNSLNLKKINCNNINLNINNGQGTNGNSTNENGDNQNKTNHGLKKFNKDGFAFVCVNNNDNQQITPSPTTNTETLTVIKNVNCQANSTICANNPISPSDFTITIQGNTPSQNNFLGSSDGTNVELETGKYSVTEEGLDTSPHPVCTRLGYESSSSLGNNLFICTNFSDGCEGDITVGSPQTCTIDNVLIFCEVTVDTITGLGNTLPPEPGLLNLPTEIAYDSVHERMYVVNTQDNSVSIIDTNTNTVIYTIPAVGSAPQGIAYDLRHQYMYVTNNLFDNSVSVIDTNTNTVIGSPILVGNSPWGIAYDPIHRYMYVVNQGDGTVSVIDTNTNTVIDIDPTTPLTIDPIIVGNSPVGIEYDPIHRYMYVTNTGDGTVSVIDTNTNTVIGSPILVGNSPVGIEYDPIHRYMYVANFDDGTVSVIDTNTNTVIGSPITVGNNPAFLAYDPINQDIYAVNQEFAFPNGTVSVIDTTTNTVIGSPITVGNQPIDIAYDPVNHRMYVTNQGEDTVSVINLC